VQSGRQFLGVNAYDAMRGVLQSLEDALSDTAAHARHEYVAHRPAPFVLRFLS
jgi:hypothetical protein